jgi:hypothetical protein
LRNGERDRLLLGDVLGPGGYFRTVPPTHAETSAILL